MGRLRVLEGLGYLSFTHRAEENCPINFLAFIHLLTS